MSDLEYAVWLFEAVCFLFVIGALYWEAVRKARERRRRCGDMYYKEGR